MNANMNPLEAVSTELHLAHVNVAEGIGVGVAATVDPTDVHEVAVLWESREELDLELRVLGMAVVQLLPAGRFLVGPAPWTLEAQEGMGDLDGSSSSPLWSADSAPAYAEGLAALVGMDLRHLWDQLEGLLGSAAA